MNPIYKPWGHTYRLPQPDGSEVHVAHINAGGESSWHSHSELVNGFFVISGEVRIEQEVGPDVDLGPGDFLAVETGNKHKFKCLKDAVLVENYGRVNIERSKVH